MRLYSKVKYKDLGKIPQHKMSLDNFSYYENSLHLLAAQKYELERLTDIGLASQDLQGIVCLIYWIQDQIKDVNENIIFPYTDDPDESVEEQDIIIAPGLQDKLHHLRAVQFEDCALLINDEDSFFAEYAKHCLQEGHLDPCGYLLNWLNKD